MGMGNLPDDLLIEAHTKAVELELDHEFILLLEEEIEKRKLVKV